ILVEWLTEPPDSSALTMRRCCGAVAGIVPVAGSAPRRWARPSALRADSRREGVVLAGGAGAVGVVVVVVVSPAGRGLGAGGGGGGGVWAGGGGAVFVVFVGVVPRGGLGTGAAAVGPPARDARN